jgi:quinol monooxygenase YgiN
MSRFTLIAEFEAKEGQRDRLARELTGMIQPSLAEDGCLAYRPYVDATDHNRFIIIEEWADQAALDLHFDTAHFKRVARVLEDILTRPFNLARLSPIPDLPTRRDADSPV